MSIRRGEIYSADLDPTHGSEQRGRRPVLVLQNDIGNEYAATTIIAPLTTKAFAKTYPTNVPVPAGIAGLKQDPTILLSQIRTIDKSRLDRRTGALPAALMAKVEEAARISLDL
ncbi:MAG: type II toxin-antitoxin system PemK/MazF family toxin [Candidatus Omnitrophica bacterium]|nr:type II toxin-antitoxin system PemK/MazF family toxin [Candidatus Omnitrophota bacterium]